MWTTHVLNATSKKEDKLFQLAFSLSVERKSLFLAASSLTKDLANHKEHLCWHEPDRKTEDTADSMLPSPHWWCPNKFVALEAWRWHMWWGQSLLSDVSESKRELPRININDQNNRDFLIHYKVFSAPPNQVHVRSFRHSHWPIQSYSATLITAVGHQVVC